jgi:transposase
MEIPAGHIVISEKEYNQLKAEIAALKFQLAEVLNRNHKDSTNSHKPPSSDGLKKKKVIKNNHQPSGKKPGGQLGHKGETREMVDNPDFTVIHPVEGKCECGSDLGLATHIRYNYRQVFDIPMPKFEVTEHLSEVKECKCGRVHYGEKGIHLPVQYGNGVYSLAVYLNQYDFIPFKRQQEFWKELYGMNVSMGMLLKANQKCYTQLETTFQNIKEQVASSPVINNDETGIRCNGELKWIHTNSTNDFTYLEMHPNRGQEAIDEIGILQDYNGISIHDRYSSYDKYECGHALCNAHLVRDLKFLHEEENKVWAGEMIPILLDANALKQQNKLAEKIIQNVKNTYDKAIEAGFLNEPPIPVPIEKKRGRKAKPKSLLLLETFKNRKDQILKFLDDPLVPFTNNLAERDLRPVKGKLKVSGCFRTDLGEQIYCRIRSYISTVKKQGLPVLESIRKVLDGEPIIFDFSNTA